MSINASIPSDVPPNEIEKPGYWLEFDDAFRDVALDTSKWLPFYLPQWSSRQLAAARYSLPGTGLRLLIEEDQQPWCPMHDGAVRVSSLQTGCYAGPVDSPVGQHRFNSNLTVTEAQPTVKLYTPQYGYFETRLRALPIAGYMVSLWMIGFEQHPEQSAEICICEIFGSEMADGRATVGYGIHPFYDPTITDEFYRDQVELDASNFHIYAAEWKPAQVDFYIDNVMVRTVAQSPKYPMQFMLGFYEIPNQLSAQSSGSRWPKLIEVDYIRAYRPRDGYEGERRFA